ncbi:hypothetical protein ACFY12_10565 [Streptomyces sp. NPDC001339]|uniref:hypothetical protein n=1 Tax=Streptomyces sp. NPDC001339 TaxID=3364563 RepID=UPI0036C5ED2E
MSADTLDECPEYVRAGVDHKRIDVRIADDVRQRADACRSAGQGPPHSLPPVVEQLLTAA